MSSSSLCPHAGSFSMPPKFDAAIHKEECTKCYFSDECSPGLSVCLTCFNGGCNGDLNHAAEHFEVTKGAHKIVLRILKKPPISLEGGDYPMQVYDGSGSGSENEVKSVLDVIQQLQDAPKPTYELSVHCLECKKELDYTSDAKLAACVSAIMNADSATTAKDSFAGDIDVAKECEHTRNLSQPVDVPDLSNAALAKCISCDINKDLWLCMTCGALGCSRRGYDGSGGNEHAVNHNKETGHPLVLKVGTITPEGSADIWCYKCDQAALDGQLEKHLSTFGIELNKQTKTAKSMSELQLALNINANFSSVWDKSGKPKELLFHRPGFVNLGNSCYMASTIQVLLSMPAFIKRYYDEGQKHLAACKNARPADCHMCQFSKLASGVYCGRYVKTPSEEELQSYLKAASMNNESSSSSTTTTSSGAVAAPSPAAEKNTTKELQPGIAIRMFKKLFTKGHADFSGNRQQDSCDFFEYLLEQIEKFEKAHAKKEANSNAPFNPFQHMTATLTEKLQCTVCHRVRYTKAELKSFLSVCIPYEESAAKEKDLNEREKEAALRREVSKKKKEEEFLEREKRVNDGTANEDEKAEYESKKRQKLEEEKAGPQGKVMDFSDVPPVAFLDCLKDWGSKNYRDDWSCPDCKKKTTVMSEIGFRKFPEFLVVNMQRFGFFDKTSWAPSKLLVDITIDTDKPIDLELLRAKNHVLAAGEEALSTDSATAGSQPKGPVADPALVDQLIQMGFGENRAKRALLATSNAGAEAAMNWCIERMEDATLDAPIVDENPGNASASKSAAADPILLSQLLDMGFQANQCLRALAATGNKSVDGAMEWIMANMDDPSMNDPFPDEQKTSASSSASSSSKSSSAVSFSPGDDAAIKQLAEMTGMPASKCKYGYIVECGKSTERAVEWLFSNMDTEEDYAGYDYGALEGEEKDAADNVVDDGSTSSSKYELFAFIDHQGASTASGHYICHVKENGKWVCFNDQKVFSDPEPAASQAYMYVLRQV